MTRRQRRIHLLLWPLLTTGLTLALLAALAARGPAVGPPLDADRIPPSEHPDR